MLYGVCKLRRAAPGGVFPRFAAGFVLAMILAAAPPACRMNQVRPTLTVTELENAPPAVPLGVRRAIASETLRQCDFYRPLGRRLGLLSVRDDEQWEQLRALAPEIGPCPDLDLGMVVGIVSHAGMPLDGEWPIELETVRVCRGAGYALARFDGGSFLADGVNYVEIAQIEGLSTVLIAEVDGARFYPR